MELFKMTTHKDDAWKVIETLGHENLVQFINMNEKMDIGKRLYSGRIQSCDSTEKQILTLLSACRDYKIKINKPVDSQQFLRNIRQIELDKRKSHDMLLDAIETEVNDIEGFVMSQRETLVEIANEIDKLEDYLEVVNFVKSMMDNLNGARPAKPVPVTDAEDK